MSDPVFVLSGGGNLGAVQVGMLQRLLGAGIRPDAVFGSSVGALNAAALALDPTVGRADELAEIWQRVTVRDVFAGDRRLGMVRVLFGQGALHSPRGLEALIGRFFAPDDLARTAIPVHVSTTDLSSGVSRWWRAGDPLPILLASCAIPVVFPPVELEGALHVDGALVEPVGLRRAAALSSGPIIVLDTGATSMPLGPVDNVAATISSAIRAGRMARLADDRGTVDPDRVHWIEVDCPRVAYDDFTRTDELLELGREAADRFLRTAWHPTGRRGRCAGADAAPQP
jgi:NTE family protein